MKIRKIKLTNFEKFSNQTKVFEFEKDDDLILIYGANGEGKTTIADAIFVAFTKKTYENKQFNPTNNEKDVIIEIEFDIDNKKHTIKRIIQKKNGINSWTTKIDGIECKEKDVIDVLEKTVGLNGIKNFFICVHPLYLINPDSNTKELSLKLFFELMSSAAQKELKTIVDSLLKNNEEDIFSKEEIEKLEKNPLEIINFINTLSEQTKDFKKEYDEKLKTYKVLESQLSSSILDDELIESYNVKIKDLENQKNEIDQSLKENEENNKKINELKNELEAQENSKKQLQDELSKYNSELSSLNYDVFISQHCKEEVMKRKELNEQLTAVNKELNKIDNVNSGESDA